MFGIDLTLVLAMLTILLACGWWAVSPFRHQLAYPLAVAPLAGMVLLPLGALSVFVVLGQSVPHAAVVVTLALFAASLASVLIARPTSSPIDPVVVASFGLASVAAVGCLTRVDLFFGAPGLMYAHGTDHLGYAHIADWMRARPGNVAFTPVPDDWYASWPQYIFHLDPRFGSFMLLALVSVFTGRSGAFAYDIGSAVVLSAATLGVAGLFARRRLTFVLLATGLFTSFWFDWNRAGYLGKTTGYPSTVLVVGLFFAWVHLRRQQERLPLLALGALMALTAGTAIVFSGLTLGLLLAVLGVLFFISLAAFGSRGLADPAIALAILVALGILASGIIARPLFTNADASIPWTWWDLLLRSLEFDGLLPGRTGVPLLAMQAMAIAMLAAWASVLALAVSVRNAAASALTAAPLVLIASLAAGDRKWLAMSFIGVYLPLLLCGAVVLADSLTARENRRRWRLAIVALLVASIAIHIPRFAATAAFHGGKDAPPLFRFSSVETDALAAAIQQAGGSALVDIDDAPHFSIFLMVELGRRGIPLQWTEKSWGPILGYRPWPVPMYPKPAPLRIVLRDGKDHGRGLSILQTTQFELLRQP